MFAHEPWSLSETNLDPARNALAETLFALGNGHIGLRGAHEEGFDGAPSQDGCYVNGLYDTEPIHYPEAAYGLAKQNQFMLSVPNGKRIALWLDSERFDLQHGRVLRYARRLDFRSAVLERHVEWKSPHGARVEITSRRLVCLQRQHVYAIDYRVRSLDFSGSVTIASSLDGRVKNLEAGDDPRVGSHVSQPPLVWLHSRHADARATLVQRTRRSAFTLVSALEHRIDADGAVHTEHETSGDGQCLTHRHTLALQPGQELRLTKFGGYHASRDDGIEALLARSTQDLARARLDGFDKLCTEQAAFLTEFWQHADVEIDGDDALQQGLRFNALHLLQSVGRDGRTNIAAKGLTGEGYEGHTFWDTEIYVLPFFVATRPEIARALLEYRARALPAARERARQLAHRRGALFPWRTIAGDECSAYFPAGTAQYHLNADIAHAVKHYVEATGDEAFLVEHGAELVMDAARVWLDVGAYDARHAGRFCIYEVTGPDEYTAMVDNNFYTNAMAQQHLAFAARTAQWLRDEHPCEYARIAQILSLADNEPEHWQRAADLMHLPIDETLGVHPQADGFLSKPVWDFAATPADHYPLLLHYHPLVIYRHQVCKQADVVLALLLRGERFTLEQKRRDFDYYEPLTTHDSSLSECIFGIVAAELGDDDKAYDYFARGARTDLDDRHGNTRHGVHTAAMAGSWLGLVQGFGGLRWHDGQLRFAPTLPARWRRYAFRVRQRDAQLQVSVDGDGIEYRLLDGAALELQHRGETVALSGACPVVRVPHAETQPMPLESA